MILRSVPRTLLLSDCRLCALVVTARMGQRCLQAVASDNRVFRPFCQIQALDRAISTRLGTHLGIPLVILFGLLAGLQGPSVKTFVIGWESALLYLVLAFRILIYLCRLLVCHSRPVAPRSWFDNTSVVSRGSIV